MIFTRYADIKSVIDAVNSGEIFRYLTKPWDPAELVAVLHQACEYYDAITERAHLLADLWASPWKGWPSRRCRPAGGGRRPVRIIKRIDRTLKSAK